MALTPEKIGSLAGKFPQQFRVPLRELLSEIAEHIDDVEAEIKERLETIEEEICQEE